MSDMAKELIQQALDQDYNSANKTFGEIMSSKLTDILDQEKVRMADAVFNGVDIDDEDGDDILGDEDGDEQLELDLDPEDESESEGEVEEEELELDDDEEEESA